MCVLAAWRRVHLGARAARKEAVRAVWEDEGRGNGGPGGREIRGKAGCGDRDCGTDYGTGKADGPLSREGGREGLATGERVFLVPSDNIR